MMDFRVKITPRDKHGFEKWLWQLSINYSEFIKTKICKNIDKADDRNWHKIKPGQLVPNFHIWMLRLFNKVISKT